MFEAYLGATAVHWKSYIVSNVNLMFLNGAWVRDDFSLELSCLEYGV